MRSLCLGSVLALTVVFSTSAQATDAAQVGGPGGGAFSDPCRPGDVMVGYNVTDGKAMNTFAAVCQAQNNGVLVGKNYGLRTWGKNDDPGRGAPYHGFETPRCPAGAAVSQLEVWVNKVNEIDSVAATCAPLRPNAAGTSALQRTGTNGGAPVRQGSSACPTGMLAVGISGRSGALVDSLGLICAPAPGH